MTATAFPNVIYILADDMGYGDLSGFNPDSKIRTRHLDRLAAGGLICTDAHSSSAVCTPSRYSILTGRYNWRSWLKRGVTDGYSRPLIERDRLTVASLLRSSGYATACVGKWHLGWTWSRTGDGEDAIDYGGVIPDGPTALGFDYFYGISASLDMPPYVYVENDRPTARPDRVVPASSGPAFWREGPIAPDFKHEEVLPVLTRNALDWTERQAGSGRPFFLYFALPAPHTPIVPRPEFQGRSGTNAYGDFCLQVDAVVGEVLDVLDRTGMADNTLVIFTSVNGCSPSADFPALARLGHRPSHHFRGHKADIFEGGHRIPLIVRWPARVPAGRRTEETVCLVDLLATCAEWCGAELPPGSAEDGISNLALWEGRPYARPLRATTVHHSIDGSFSIRKGRWKLELCPGSGGWSPPRPGPECEGLPPVQLYDLESDIGERRNVAAAHPEIVSELTALLREQTERE